MDKIRVFVVDDHSLLREGLRSLLEGVPDIELVGEAGEGMEAVVKTQELVPDVVLMDIAMPGLNGLEATRQIKQETPRVKVLILTVHESDQYLRATLEAGASGYVVKTGSSDKLLSAIRAVHRGDAYLSPSIARMLVKDYLQRAERGEKTAGFQGLTKREKETLMHIAEDKKTREIANLLGISMRTVQAHRTSLMEKLGVRNSAELIEFALREGVLDL